MITDKRNGFLIAASILLIAIGSAVGAAGVSLIRLDGTRQLGIAASDSTILFVGSMAVVIAIALVLSGIIALRRREFALVAGACSTVAFVVAGFVGNAMLFNSPRLLHTGANAIVAILIDGLLWKGVSRGEERTRPH